jgi:hypothetical protein
MGNSLEDFSKVIQCPLVVALTASQGVLYTSAHDRRIHSTSDKYILLSKVENTLLGVFQTVANTL